MRVTTRFLAEPLPKNPMRERAGRFLSGRRVRRPVLKFSAGGGLVCVRATTFIRRVGGLEQSAAAGSQMG
jgi:hypothetical protein